MNQLLKLSFLACSLVLLASLTVPVSFAQDEKPATVDESAKKVEKPATIDVKADEFKIEVTVKGAFDASKKTEIAIKPESWATFKLKEEPVAHGTKVKKGDTLMVFETEEFDEQFSDAKDKVILADLGYKLAALSLEQLEKTTPMDMEVAERSAEQSADDYKYFVEVEEPQRKKSLEFNLKSSKQMVEYYQEEYEQLKKMYEADDLTEETEEIVLKRAKDSLEQANFMLERAKLQYDRTLNTLLPRSRIVQDEAQIRSKMALDKAKLAIPASLKKAQLEIKQQETALKKAKEKLDDLTKDKDLFVVKAPAAGVVYYGQVKEGKLATASTVEKLMEVGKPVTPKAVVMTILPEAASIMHTTIEEKDLHQVRKGQTVTVTPTAYPDLKIEGKITSLSRFPNAGSKYDATISVSSQDKDWSNIVPGMSGEGKILTYHVKNAILLPKDSVFSDDDGETHYVFVAGDDDKSTKTTVKTGKTSGDKIEILNGVKAGQKILKSKPE